MVIRIASIILVVSLLSMLGVVTFRYLAALGEAAPSLEREVPVGQPSGSLDGVPRPGMVRPSVPAEPLPSELFERMTRRVETRSVPIISSVGSCDLRPTMFETRGVRMQADQLVRVAGENFWEQALQRDYNLSLDGAALAYMTGASKSEVLSAVWLADIAPSSSRVVIVDLQGQQRLPILHLRTVRTPAPKQLLEVRLIGFALRESPVDFVRVDGPEEDPLVEVQFVRVSGQKDPAKAHPELTGAACALFSRLPEHQSSVLAVVVAGTKLTTSFFTVKRTRDSSPLVNIDYLSDDTPHLISPAAGCDERDLADLWLHDTSSATETATAVRVTSLSGLDVVADADQLGVKLAVFEYARMGVHNATVQAVVPVGAGTDSAGTVLEFCETTTPGCVDVCVLSAEHFTSGSTVLLSPRLCNLPAPAFVTAWNQLHQADQVTTASAITDAQNLVRTKLDSGWFRRNYGIEILEGSGAQEWLETTYGLDHVETAGLKTFDADELRGLEVALQEIGPTRVGLLRGVRFVRQTRRLQSAVDSNTQQAGFTRQFGDSVTVFIYDASRLNEGSLFTGSVRQVYPPSTPTMVHELGHVLAMRSDIGQRFMERFGESMSPVTWYAASKPATEAFPECLMLYCLQANWLHRRYPEASQWFAKELGSSN
jgi:hypothetical protein